MLDYAGGLNVITRVLTRERQKDMVGDVTMEARDWSDGRKRAFHKPRNAGASRC